MWIWIHFNFFAFWIYSPGWWLCHHGCQMTHANLLEGFRSQWGNTFHRSSFQPRQETTWFGFWDMETFNSIRQDKCQSNASIKCQNRWCWHFMILCWYGSAQLIYIKPCSKWIKVGSKHMDIQKSHLTIHWQFYGKSTNPPLNIPPSGSKRFFGQSWHFCRV